MLDPTPFFAADYFATRDVTLARLQKFTVDVITRLTADNPGQVFDALVADLTTYHAALFGAQATADAGLSQRQTEAQKMWGALADLQVQLEEDEDLLRFKAKKTPAILADFLPYGRTEYANATLLTAELLLGRAKAAAVTHRHDLTQRLTDAVKLVAAHYLRDEARAAAYFRMELLQA